MFGAVYAAEGTARETLTAVAREFSPRIEIQNDRECTLDLSGLARLFGDPRTIAEELRRTAADRGVRIRVAIASTRVAARLIVRHRAGITVILPGAERAALAPLSLSVLDALGTPTSQSPTPRPNASNDSNELIATLRRWGLRTLGDLAALPADDVAARLGQNGVHWQRLSQGKDSQPLVPAVPEERFEQALDLEWPIDGLEPLSFVLGRLMDPLSAHLERRGRGAAVLHVRLHLVKTDGATREIHERSLQLPAPMRDARALRTLALLDLESHPPAAAIDRVVVAVDPTPGRVVQFSLLTRPLPSPEQLSTLMARLGALMGEGRCGSPAVVDTWQPGAFAMTPFVPSPAPHALPAPPALLAPPLALRRFRFPVPVRVRVENGRPVRLTVDRRPSIVTRGVMSGGRVTSVAGPWRTSGNWWATGPHKTGGASGRASRAGKEGGAWDRDEWDVTLHDGATYRVFHERDGNGWFLEGLVD